TNICSELLCQLGWWRAGSKAPYDRFECCDHPLTTAHTLHGRLPNSISFPRGLSLPNHSFATASVMAISLLFFFRKLTLPCRIRTSNMRINAESTSMANKSPPLSLNRRLVLN